MKVTLLCWAVSLLNQCQPFNFRSRIILEFKCIYGSYIYIYQFRYLYKKEEESTISFVWIIHQVVNHIETWIMWCIRMSLHIISLNGKILLIYIERDAFPYITTENRPNQSEQNMQFTCTYLLGPCAPFSPVVSPRGVPVWCK